MSKKELVKFVAKKEMENFEKTGSFFQEQEIALKSFEKVCSRMTIQSLNWAYTRFTK